MDLRERTDGAGPRHPWETVRSWFFLEVLDRHGALDGPTRWLDVGAGDGYVGEQLAERASDGSSVVAWDVNYSPGDLLRDHGDVELTAARPPGPFGGVLLLDVIEHIADDRAFLADVVGDLTEPHGWVLVSVPAYQALFSEHDRFLGHHRRYRLPQCLQLLERAGVETVAWGGLFHTLLAARGLTVARTRLTGRSPSTDGVGGWSSGPAVTSTVTGVLRGDARLSLALAGRGWRLPGLSIWALGRRSGREAGR